MESLGQPISVFSALGSSAPEFQGQPDLACGGEGRSFMLYWFPFI